MEDKGAWGAGVGAVGFGHAVVVKLVVGERGRKSDGGVVGGWGVRRSCFLMEGFLRLFYLKIYYFQY